MQWACLFVCVASLLGVRGAMMHAATLHGKKYYAQRLTLALLGKLNQSIRNPELRRTTATHPSRPENRKPRLGMHI